MHRLILFGLLLCTLQGAAQSQRFNADLYAQGNALANPNSAYFPGLATGYRFGLEAGYPVAEHFELRAGLGYSNVAFGIFDRSIGQYGSESLRYLEVPMMVRFIANPEDDGDDYNPVRKRFYAEAGFIHSFLTSAHWDGQTSSSFSPVPTTQDRENADITLPYVLRPALGMGFLIGTPAARFLIGWQFSSAFRNVVPGHEQNTVSMDMPLAMFGMRLGLQLGVPVKEKAEKQGAR